MEVLEKVQVFEFDGSIESFHLMMKRLYPHQNWSYFVYWLNEEGKETNIWYGRFIDKKTQAIYKKGDWYFEKVSE